MNETANQSFDDGRDQELYHPHSKEMFTFHIPLAVA
jgi:hypothetical protein